MNTCVQFNWKEAGAYTDIKYHKMDGIAKITINRPHVRNAFRPQTVDEMMKALEDARNDNEIGVIILTGEGKDAFCSGGDQKIRGDAGYNDGRGVERLNVLDFQRQIRTCPKPVIAMVAGYAIGGGHVLHVVCDLTIAADNAIFGQVGPKVGSFDGGFGSSYLARIVGQKKAREIWFLCRQYTAREALDMRLINHVVPYEELEATTVQWANEMLQHSPIALRCLKSALNADCDGQAGLQELAGNATMLFYMTEEGQEGRNAFIEKGNQIMTSSPSALKAFVIASRPKTLIAGISPVLIGFALAGMRSFPLFLSTLLFSVLIQIGTNYANDYYDFLSGADAKRVGPARATASGWITPEQMKLAFIVLFAAAFLSSIPLIIECGPIALPFILSSIAFGILYTGGPKPLGYMGLGDILVLLYFGPVAIAGTYYVQLHEYPNFFLTLPPALLSVAILTANNLRDEDTDKVAHKNTLVVRYGKFFGAWEYTICVLAAALIPVFFGHYLPLLILPLFRSPFKEKNIGGLLPHTALLLIFFTGLFCYDCSL